MSDNNIPFEIQMEIMKWFPVKPLIQFRSVSKQWKSFIDSSHFINGYGARHTHPCSRILRYISDYSDNETNFICLVDDDIETFQQQFVVSPLLKQYYMVYEVVGVCHGLLCLYGLNQDIGKEILVIWNPSIRKSFGIAVYYNPDCKFGFGVCPVTRDPIVVKVVCTRDEPWHVELFTLSSGVWNVIPTANLPRQSHRLKWSTQVVIDRFIYWGAWEETFTHDGKSTTNHMVVSFDLITKEFKVVYLPDTLTNELLYHVSLSKLRGSLVVSGSIQVEGALCYGVWVMEHDSSFTKLFNIGTPVYKILRFRKNGELLFQIQMANEKFTTLNVYDPCSQQIKNLGISGVAKSFFMGSYKESLLLLDHSDLHIYSDDDS